MAPDASYVRINRSVLGLTLGLTFVPVSVPAQVPTQGLPTGEIEARGIQTIALDPRFRHRSLDVPFLERFLLSVPVYKCAKSGRLLLIRAANTEAADTTTHELPVNPYLFKGDLTGALIDPLVPNELYSAKIAFQGGKLQSDGSCTSSATDTTHLLEYGLNPRAPRTTHFDLDVGFVATLRKGYFGLIVALHYHFSPLNENTPEWYDAAGSRWSLFAGLGLVELGSFDEVEHPFPGGIPMTGLAYSLRDVRLLTGLALLQQIDPNPIVDTERVSVDFLAGASIDLGLTKVLGAISKALGIP